MQAVIGDLGCEGVDVEAWERVNRCPLFPNKTQRWILVMSAAGKNEAAIAEELEKCLYFWLGLQQGSIATRLYDSVKIERISREPLSMPAPIKRRDQLAGFASVKGPDLAYVSVSFAYRGTAADMPWPVRTLVWMPNIGMAARCPVNADWMLWQVGAPSLDDAPPEPDVLDVITRGTARTLSGLAVPMLAAAGLLGLYIYATRSRS